MGTPLQHPSAPMSDAEAVRAELFQQPTAYPYPAGSACLGWLYEASEADLRQLSYARLRDQAIAVDAIFEQYKGRYLAFVELARECGLTPYVAAQLAQTEASLRRIQAQRGRLRALLDAGPGLRVVARN